MEKIFVGTLKWFWRYFSGGKYLENYRWNICAVFLERIWGGHWEIFVRYFEEDIEHYILFVEINSQTNIFEMKFKIHFEFTESLRKFQDLNFRGATTMDVRAGPACKWLRMSNAAWSSGQIQWPRHTVSEKSATSSVKLTPRAHPSALRNRDWAARLERGRGPKVHSLARLPSLFFFLYF
jgi:hypothetical protein